MFAVIAFASLTFQQLGPLLPPSCSPAFQATVLSIEEALQSQDFERAKARLRLLPRTSVSYSWDESKVPQNSRDEYRRARDAAFAMWKAKLPKLLLTPGSKPDIRISFEPVLARRPDSNLPAGHVGFFGEDPTQPRLDFVIGLKRGYPSQSSQLTDVFNDTAYAIGMYFGIADGVDISRAMGSTDLSRENTVAISGTELSAVRSNMNVVSALERAVQNKIPIIAAKAELHLRQTVIEAAPALQGDHVDVDLEVSNSGTGPLSFSMAPDCGCTAVTAPGTVEPQSTRLLRIAIDTRLFSRDMVKHVTLSTNDPVNPVSVVTIKVPIQPRYLFVVPDGDRIVVPTGGRKFVVYLILAKGADLDPVSYKLQGMNNTISMTPFHGILKDPKSNEGPKLQSGFKFVIDIKDDLPPGPVSGTLLILTSNSDFPNFAYTMYAQKGIISLPEEVSMGQLSRAPRMSSFLISGPGTPMKVTSVETNNPNLRATFDPVPGPLGYTVHVEYDGKGKHGELIADVKVRTTDLKQPIIHVPIHATIQ